MGLSKEMIENSHKKDIDFWTLKAELDSEMMLADVRIEKIKQMIIANIKSESNKEGLLNQGAATYLKCLQFNHGALEDHLQNDASIWRQNMVQVRQQAENMKKEF